MATVPYTVDPDDPTRPTEGMSLGAAAAELRALKERVLTAREETADLESRAIVHTGAAPYVLAAELDANNNKISGLATATAAFDAMGLSQTTALIEALVQDRLGALNQITWTPGLAVVATPARQWTIQGNVGYIATANHTASASFAADVAAGLWLQLDVLQLYADLMNAAVNKGASLIYANDGAAGTLFTTVAGFISRVLSGALTISGVKTFSSTIDGNISGSAARLGGELPAAYTKSSGISELGTSARTTAELAAGFAGGIQVRNSGTGAGTATYFDAVLGGVMAGGVQFLRNPDGSVEARIGRTPAGDPAVDRRVYDTVVRGNGVLAVSGINETTRYWRNVSRARDTTYQNTTGKDIEVVVTFRGRYGRVNVGLTSGALSQITGDTSGLADDVNSRSVHHLTIPANHYYRFTSANLDLVSELY